MKRIIAIFFTLMLIFALCCTAASEESTAPKFVTLREWLMNKRECGDCMLLLKIHDVMVDVLALAGDETDQVTMYSGGENEIILNFMDDKQNLTGYWIVIANPEYNEFEGNVEMKNWETLRLIPGDI